MKSVACAGCTPCGDCADWVRFENSARSFKKPARIVPLAVERGIIGDSTRVLEVGAGSLRNAVYLLDRVGCPIDVYEVDATISRFGAKYRRLERRGSRVYAGRFPARKYDIVLCTFVLETLCPSRARTQLVVRIRELLRKNGMLLLAMRGPKDIKTNRPNYGRGRPCPCNDGFLTPLRTFIKPFTIPELQRMLAETGFTDVAPLHAYRTPRPQIIHMIASR